MPARRSAVKAKLSAVPDAVDNRVGGRGLDWSQVPEVLDDTGRTEWVRLAAVYEALPTRFREGDRVILTAFCAAWSVYLGAVAELGRDGVLVAGRSAPDRGRRVKSPALAVGTQAGTQLRYLASALGLSPDARGRSGIREQDAPLTRDPGWDLLS